MRIKKKPRDVEEVKVILRKNAWHGHATEDLWAEKINEGKYKIRNVPFYAFGVSHMDIVSTYTKEEIVYFSKVLIHSGHSTYRIILDKNVDEKKFEEFWTPIQELGCSYEEGIGRLYAIDVLPTSDINEVYRLLEKGVKSKVWDFEEGDCGHSLK